ncbi:MAG TPA: extracellular solute-binding protein [Candidatus Acetatifactor stercoripullorum]|uniref:Extracellular solute-binding protein n=1 Tax=Candidatus Acetatifactor stercoripullorum TaxID=2838414 RepID=A0A9D1R717_9FIRM|nr:hypothetical protein [uncultured Acetatifactor sp.]HIW81262.1 extracellular solute-binding protein [Candidatus Acetatifactor stercoripullorum]
MKRWISILVLTAMLLGACCRTQENGEENPETYSAAETDRIPVACWETADMQMASEIIGDTLYYVKGDWNPEKGWIDNACIYKKELNAGEEQKIADFGGKGLLLFLLDEEGAVYSLYGTEKESTGFFLQKQDNEGKLVYERLIVKEDDSQNTQLFQGIADASMGEISKEGEVCLANADGGLYLFDADGKLLHSGSAGWDAQSYHSARKGLVNAGSEGIYTYSIEEREILFQKMDTAGGRLQEIKKIDLGVLGMEQGAVEIYDGYEMGILISDSDALWKYDISQDSLEKALDWGAGTVNLKGYIIDAIGITEEEELYLLAHTSYDDVISARVVYQDEEYIPQKQTVTLGLIESYGVVTEIAEDMDIIVLDHKKVLEDLEPYFQTSDQVSEEELLPCVVRAGTISQSLVCVFPHFQINGFWVEKGTVQDGSWTTEEYLAFGESAPWAVLMDGNPKYYYSDVLRLLMQADMDSEKFYENLVLTKTFYMSGIYCSDVIERNGGLAQGESYEVAGYPNQEGKPVFEIIPPVSFGINSASGNKEGAWAFLEYLLSKEYQDRVMSFPVREDSFERQLALEQYRHSDMAFSEEDREFLRFMVDNGYWLKASRALEISVMISEEMAPVWEGEKTVEEAAQILQNRVMLYLNE